MRLPRLVLAAVVLAACTSTRPDSDTDQVGSVPPLADGEPLPAPSHHKPGEPLKSWAKAVPHGAIGGAASDPADFSREGCSCHCAEKMGECKCLHCVVEAGAKCYCDAGEPKCLCGIDMGGCRCSHCAGREGTGVCPCDHSATRKALDEGKTPAPK